jgi:hypothetical protein
MGSVTFLVLGYLLPMFAILVPLQMLHLRADAKRSGLSLGLSRLAAIASASVVAALMAGAVVGYAIMFGPSHVTGDFIGLPWFTMLPALGLGLWTVGKVNRTVGASLLRRSRTS